MLMCDSMLRACCLSRDLGLEAKKPEVEDSPLTRKIRDLESRLDKAMVKFNETQVCVCVRLRCYHPVGSGSPVL